MDLSSIESGQILIDEFLAISDETLNSYLVATNDAKSVYAPDNVIPPMAIAALVMGSAMSSIQLTPGAVHTGQDLAFFHSVDYGTQLHCQVMVSQNTVRRNVRFLNIDFVINGKGEIVMTGRSSIVIPEESPSS